MGCIYKLKRSPFWWIKYIGVDGRPQYESTKSTEHAVAKDTLKLREGKIAEGVPVTSAVSRLKFTDEADNLVNHYKIKGRRTLAELELRLRLHLTPFFGRYRMAQIDTALCSATSCTGSPNCV
jgi:hypothetical protein